MLKQKFYTTSRKGKTLFSVLKDSNIAPHPADRYMALEGSQEGETGCSSALSTFGFSVPDSQPVPVLRNTWFWTNLWLPTDFEQNWGSEYHIRYLKKAASGTRILQTWACVLDVYFFFFFLEADYPPWCQNCRRLVLIVYAYHPPPWSSFSSLLVSNFLNSSNYKLQDTCDVVLLDTY